MQDEGGARAVAPNATASGRGSDTDAPPPAQPLSGCSES